jgi:hypothetical protein
LEERKREREDVRGRFALTADPRTATTNEIPVAVGRHPFGALQVAFPDGSRPLGFVFGVYAQDDPRRLCPICTLGAGIEEPQICDQVVFVVKG